MEILGISIPLPEFPILKSIRGIGISDRIIYEEHLARIFDYRNTHFDRPPQLDLANPPEFECGIHDFVVCSEVFEHVPPPALTAFQSASRLLNGRGILILTLPYSLEPASLEHFPELYEYGLVRLGDQTILVNRTPAGVIESFDQLVFHISDTGKSLEMRELTERDVLRNLEDAGFANIRIYSEDVEKFGIYQREAWSLPIAARKSAFALSRESVAEIVGQLVSSRQIHVEPRPKRSVADRIRRLRSMFS
jgi:SAM-dependent methyltransferase